MRFILTNHAKKRMDERNIPLDQIKQTIEFPEYIITKNQKIESYKRINQRLIKVVYLKKDNFIKIITVI